MESKRATNIQPAKMTRDASNLRCRLIHDGYDAGEDVMLDGGCDNYDADDDVK